MTGKEEPCENAAAPASIEDEIAHHLRAADVDIELVEDPPLIPTKEGSPLHPGIELGLADIAQLMAEQHSHLVGILGAHDTGKTMFLVSLYLLIACGKASAHGYSFSGSLTLPGFEARARATRQWVKGQMPERMSIHTQLSDERSPGFLHIDMTHGSSKRRVRLLLSDLPGEWTTDLLRNIRHADRFEFLKSAAAVVLMVDGPTLANRESRHREVERQKTLVDRIASIAEPEGRPMAIVVTKGDVLGMAPPDALEGIVRHAQDRGFAAVGRIISSFSGDRDIPSGTGVFEAIRFIVERRERAFGPLIAAGLPKRFFGWMPVTNGRGV